MRWWMVTSGNRLMGVENQDVRGMDYTPLPSNTAMVEWIDGKGEIEYSDRPRLRVNFQDMAPYAPYFQQFMVKLGAGLTLNQAKKLQSDLVIELFDNKRQLPFAYTVSAGALVWEATDDAVAAMAAVGLPAVYNLTVGSTNSMLTQINNTFAALSGQINSYIVNVGNALIGFINTTIGTRSDLPPAPPSINLGIQQIGLVGGATAARGVESDLSQTGLAFSSVGVAAITPPTGSITIPWIPIGGTAPVNLSVAELMGLMQGIANRRSSLIATKNSKVIAIFALTTVADVIAYDVTSGW